MNTIYAEYNMYHNSIDIYTSAGYMLRIDCNKAEDGLKTTPCSQCSLNAYAEYQQEVDDWKKSNDNAETPIQPILL
jgi:hypothetical protein